MFTSRKTLYPGRYYDTAFLKGFLVCLNQSGYSDIHILLPNNMKLAKTDLTIDEFIEKDRNYRSQIIVAKNIDNGDILKILIVNISEKSFFSDDTFPSGHSEPSEIYVKSNDPLRANATVSFFYEYFKEKGKTNICSVPIVNILLLISIVTIAMMSPIVSREIDVKFFHGTVPLIVLQIVYYLFCGVFITMFLLWFIRTSGHGIYIKKKPKHTSLGVWINRAIHGEFIDNPLVVSLSVIISGIVICLFSGLLIRFL